MSEDMGNRGRSLGHGSLAGAEVGQKEATKWRKKRESTSFQGSAQTKSDITLNCNAAVGRSLRKRRLVSLDRLRIRTVELHPQLRCSVFVPGESKLRKELGRSGGK